MKAIGYYKERVDGHETGNAIPFYQVVSHDLGRRSSSKGSEPVIAVRVRGDNGQEMVVQIPAGDVLPAGHIVRQSVFVPPPAGSDSSLKPDTKLE